MGSDNFIYSLRVHLSKHEALDSKWTSYDTSILKCSESPKSEKIYSPDMLIPISQLFHHTLFS